MLNFLIIGILKRFIWLLDLSLASGFEREIKERRRKWKNDRKAPKKK